MKQGQTRYHYMVLIFKEEEEIDIELPLTEEEIQDKYDGKIQKEMSGKTYEVITDLFRAVTGRKPIAPKDFVGHSGTPAITCSHKAASGFLYPLDKGLIYIYKPPIYLRYDEMQRVEFDRTGGSSRSFDIKVTNIHDITYTFSSIEKGEYSKLYDYLKGKKVKITSGGTAGGKINWDDRTEDKGIDHHLEKVKQDAEIFSSGSDDMSSDDTDFNPDALEALSAKEEYDSEPSETSSEEESEDYGSGSDADRKREESRKRKEEKKARKVEREKKASEPKEKRTKKKKMTKLPGQPKKNQSAYFLWMNHNREQIKKDHPGLSMTDMTKKAGEIWRDLADKTVS